VAFMVYWTIGSKRLKAQNIFLLAASYFFYAVWDWRFLFLLLASSLVDYASGLQIEKTGKKSIQKLYLWFSVIWNLGVLITFKYFNFFVDGFYQLFQLEQVPTYSFWNVAIPVGLSFYTFQTMGYTIDVYRQRVSASKNLLQFLCFVSFFPQLVAGPIERAKKLLPQFQNQRLFDSQLAKDGLRQILWGLFKKIIVAEKLGIAVQMAFNNPEEYHFITLIYAAILFCFQVYCDFSGYTDIAIGTGKLLGFELSKNFRFPYLATSITDFWQRWHITLTRWFTDYVYIPFIKSFKKITIGTKILGLFVTMSLVGLWHGPKWTFICFGLFNAALLMLERIRIGSQRQNLHKWLMNAPRLISWAYVFFAFTVSAIFFRAATFDDATLYLSRVFSFASDGKFNSLIEWKVGYLLFLIVTEVVFMKRDFPLQQLERWAPKPIRWAIYYILIFTIIQFAEHKEAFIYFQF